MATWIVGDVHGWLEVFENLLRAIGFDPERDCLWLAGDLVNRIAHERDHADVRTPGVREGEE